MSDIDVSTLSVPSFEKLIREDLQDFMPYASARSEKLDGELWLNANECPWDASETGLLWNRYPEQQPEAIINALATRYKVKSNQVLVTRGSDEGIDLLVRLFCRYQQDGVFACAPTFGMYKIYAKIQGVKYDEYSLTADADFKLDVERFIQAIPESCKLVFLCSPNNPTGKITSENDIEEIVEALQHRCVLVVDEAYIEFANAQSATLLLEKYDNLVVLKTLSKAYGLAGVRVGILISNMDLVQWLKKILPPYPVPKPCTEAILASFDPSNILQVESRVQVIILEREKLFLEIEKLEVVEKIWASQGNYLLVKFKQDISEMCLEQGIVLRNMKKIFGGNEVIRISIGLPEENKILLEMLTLVNMAYETV
jgi:histidinol-phosphate aminotransferase